MLTQADASNSRINGSLNYTRTTFLFTAIQSYITRAREEKQEETAGALVLLGGWKEGIRPVKTEWWVPAWFSVWGEVQICI